MLWKPKETRKFVEIRVEDCFDKVFYHVNSRILKCKMKNVITMHICEVDGLVICTREHSQI
jgi:hypothetical protein